MVRKEGESLRLTFFILITLPYSSITTYWIQHRCSGGNPMGPMEYGIVRNNFYKMIVAGVSGLGNSCITPEVMRDNYPNSYADVIVDFSGQE